MYPSGSRSKWLSTCGRACCNPPLSRCVAAAFHLLLYVRACRLTPFGNTANIRGWTQTNEGPTDRTNELANDGKNKTESFVLQHLGC